MVVFDKSEVVKFKISNNVNKTLMKQIWNNKKSIGTENSYGTNL